jgi:hypothetical protein
VVIPASVDVAAETRYQCDHVVRADRHDVCLRWTMTPTPKVKRQSAHDHAIEVARQVATVAGYRADRNRESEAFRKAYVNAYYPAYKAALHGKEVEGRIQ